MKAILFDVDNTLYDAKQYYLGAFKEISEYLSKKYKISKREILNELTNLWIKKTSMYPRLFDDVLNLFNLNDELENVIKIFNNYNGKLKPYPDVIPTLKELKKRNYKLGVITDGDRQRQKRKLKLLELIDFFDIIILTKELGSPKPSERPFQEAIAKLRVTPQNSFYVGDNPLVDFEGAKKVGMRTVRLLKGEFKDIPSNQYVDHEIEEINGLLNIVEGVET